MSQERLKQAKSLMSQLAKIQKYHCLVSWRNPHSKTPRFLLIGGKNLIGAQHGEIVVQGGEHGGFYERTMEFAGLNSDIHEIIVSTEEKVTTIPYAGVEDVLVMEFELEKENSET